MTTAPHIEYSALVDIDIIIPCRNEENHISQMLDSVLQQRYPISKMNIYIIDGMSTDKTLDVVESLAAEHKNIYVVQNPFKTTPHALNIGIKNSKSPYIVRMDCHAEYPPNYLYRLITEALASGADNVGGSIKTVPSEDGAVPRAIAIALQLPIGVGNSRFRTGGTTEPIEVDTVPFGCFRRSIFTKIGLFDEEMLRNQDDELNARIRKNGGKIILLPDIEIIYFARSNLKSLWTMFFQYGEYKMRSNIKSGSIVSLRQFAPGLLALSIVIAKILLFSPYPLLAFTPDLFYFSAIYSYFFISRNNVLRHTSLKDRVLCAFAVNTMHLSYGFGFLYGIYLFLRKSKKNDIKLSR
ncbi:Poly-beta-1,6-N-acetyl-D-glucosamine synthase [compost metagenome]